MALDAPLVLPSDVEIVSVTRLSDRVRSGLDCADDDFAVTRHNSRNGSHVVGADVAALLRLFRAPTRMADAVLAYSRVEGRPAGEILEEIYPFLFRLWSENVLVPADRPEVAPIESHFKVGRRIQGYRIVRCIQALEDTEVLLGQDDAGSFVAIKAARLPRRSVDRLLEHEAMMLTQVGPLRSPRVADFFRADDRAVLVTEWINGVDVGTSARRLREESQRKLLSLCQDVAASVADIHAQGVAHGDIHGRNLIVERSGQLRLIDFGLAQNLGQLSRSVPRGGVPFYFDPEYAQGQLDGQDVPLTAAAEQYAVAALLYQLWAGAPYLDWRLEREQMLGQIVHETPLPFDARRVRPWPALESVLGRALSKDAAARYGSMRDLGTALGALVPVAASRRKSGRTKSERLADRFVRQCEAGSAPSSLRRVPVSSLAYGAAGAGYGLYRLALSRRDPRLISLTEAWIHRAYDTAGDANAFLSDELSITPDTVGELSLFHSPSGLHFVQALVSASVGDVETSDRAVDALVQHSRLPCSNPDLTLGTGSLLLAFAELLESLPASRSYARETARRRGDEIATQLERVLHTERISSSKLLPALGVAHGWAGVLYVMMRWRLASGAAPDSVVGDRLDELLDWAQPARGGLQWPVHNSQGPLDFLDGWCNGTAGHALLFELAYRVFARSDYGEASILAAESAHGTETEVGTLCCGLAGIAYGLLSAYRLTDEKRWWQRAERLARRAGNCRSDLFYEGSLYKGAVGVAVLDEELRERGHIAMPVFEPVV